VPGGGVDLGRELSRSIPRLYLSVGARLLPEEIVEVALGFPVLRKAAVADLLGGRTRPENSPDFVARRVRVQPRRASVPPRSGRE